MKKINITEKKQDYQIKRIQAFSNAKNKIWKMPKWKENKPIKGYQTRYKKKRYLRKGWKLVFLKKRPYKPKRIRLKRWRRHMLRSRKIKKSFLKKLRKKIFFWKKLIKLSYRWFKKQEGLLAFYFERNYASQYTKKSHWVKTRLKKKRFKKKNSLAIKKILYQPYTYWFKKNYKKKFLKKKQKSFFFKSLEISLIKFSLIENSKWFHMFTKNQVLFNLHPIYNFDKSKRIKEFFNIFTRNNLFNQIKQISFLYSRRYFQYIHNHRKEFGDFDDNIQKFPWWETLMFSQQTYKHRLSWKSQQFWFHKPLLLFTFKYYYRYKKPWEEKKKSLYYNFSYLVYNMDHNNTLTKPKRVKQLLNKVLLPFYGHIKPKQLRSVYKKAHSVKSKALTSSDLLLNNLENRLDVVIYRLNIAPNIIWARRLIRAGLVFLQQNQLKQYINDCFQKKKLYPVKLNKIFDLYGHSLNDWRIKKFTFKTKPVLKVNFKTKPGDIIQCHPFSLYQKWSIRPDLLNKPVPNYLLTKTKIDLNTEWNHWYRYLINNKKYLLLFSSAKKNRWKRNPKFTPFRFEWDNELSKETTSIFLFKPKRKDFQMNDRSASLFLNWTIQ